MKYSFSIFISIALTISSALQAQYSSRLSGFGLGKLQSPVYGTNRGCGELAAGYNSNVSINFQNPASYSSANYTVFDIGAYVENGYSNIGDSSYKSSSGGLSHFAVLLPIKSNQWGMMVGMAPYSHAKFTNSTLYKDALVGDVIDSQSASGGMNHIFIGSGYKIKNFSFGANLGYMFGNINNEQFIYIRDSAGLDARTKHNINIHSLYYQLGFQYRIKFENNNSILLGLFGSSNINMVATDQYRKTVNYPISGGFIENGIFDTFSSRFTFPGVIGFGFTYNHKNHLTYGADFKLTNWSAMQYNAPDSGFYNNWKIHAGIEYKPIAREGVNAKNYFKRIIYRAGFSIGKSEQRISYGGINEVMINGNLSFPAQAAKIISYLNLGFDFGARGFDSDTYSETYWRINIGFTITDKWFLRPKFD
ncbi:MAG: hypothetical protein IPK03_15965 [Bacteroidetes bacterium]|nr:hypothetical protein [Bacteroidota bacterium]